MREKYKLKTRDSRQNINMYIGYWKRLFLFLLLNALKPWTAINYYYFFVLFCSPMHVFVVVVEYLNSLL